jgi:hypothetical protein
MYAVAHRIARNRGGQCASSEVVIISAISLIWRVGGLSQECPNSLNCFNLVPAAQIGVELPFQ